MEMKALLVRISQLSPRDPKSSRIFEVSTIWSSLLPRKTSATNRSFQTQRNWRIVNEANAGTDRGTTSLVKIWKWLAPSILADSMISLGRVPM